jgi:predicted PolB exonuclease-like 3'-5' exonuclease
MPINKCLVLDLETKPNEIIRLWQRKGDNDFQPPVFHEIVCAGWAELDNEFRLQSMGVLGLNELTEKQTLQELVSKIDKDTLVVTWAGRRFDMPVISYRCLKHGVQTTWDKDGDFRNRYRFSGHFDLQDHMMHHGASDRLKLDHVASLLGLPGKMDTLGVQVPALVARNRWLALGTYCTTDVVQTMVMFVRYAYLIGLASISEVDQSLVSTKEYLSRLASDNSNQAYLSGRRISSLSVEKGIRKVLDNCDWSSLSLGG